MPYITKSTSLAIAARAAQHTSKALPFVALLEQPDGTILAYGSTTSCDDALQEGLLAHPLALKRAPIEFISPEKLEAIKQGRNPLLEDLGRVK